MDLCLARDTCGFAEEEDNGGGGADAAKSGPTLCGGVINSCCYVIQWHHAWGEKVGVGSVRHQLQIIDGKKTLGILIGENVGLYGGAGF